MNDRLPLPPFSAHTLTRNGYTLVVEQPVNGVRKFRIYNPNGDVVDEGAGITPREARWALQSAIESGE